MTRQVRHIRHSKYGKKFEAGSRNPRSFLVVARPRFVRRQPIQQPVQRKVSRTFPELKYQEPSPFINRGIDLVELTIPQVAPFLEAGRYIYNHREEVDRIVTTIFSDKNSEYKIQNISNIITNAVMSYTKDKAAEIGAEELTNLIEGRGGFRYINNKLNLGLDNRGQEMFNNFFKSSLEDLIRNSLG